MVVPIATPVVLGRYELPGNLASLAALAAAGQVTILPHELIRTTDGRVYHWTGTALEITSAPVHHGTVADVAALAGIYLLPSCTRGVHPGDTAFVTAAGCEYRVTSGINADATWAACASIPTSASAIGADPSGTATSAVSAHNTATDAHADIRTLIADRDSIAATRIGQIGNTTLTDTILTAGDLAALPLGWSGVLSAIAAASIGLPADVYYLRRVGARDVSGGSAYQAQGYLTPTLYIGVSATSTDLPSWALMSAFGGGTGGTSLTASESGPPALTSATLTWSFNGDANGAMYYLGSLGGTWVNPHSGGNVTVVLSSTYNIAPANFVNRDTEYGFGSGRGCFAGVDLGSGRSMRPNVYTVRNYTSADRYMRNWVFEGTNTVSANTESGWNAATWTVLDARARDTTMSSTSIWKYELTQPATAYRYFRFRLTGVDSLGGEYLCLTEFELYGALNGSFSTPLPVWARGWLTDGTHYVPGLW